MVLCHFRKAAAITIGAAHLLHSTGIIAPFATYDCKISFTFSFNAKQTG